MNQPTGTVANDSTTYEFELTYRVTVPLPGTGDEDVARDAAKKLVRDGHATLLEIEEQSRN